MTEGGVFTGPVNAFEAYLRQGKKGREVLDQVLVERAARHAYDAIASDSYHPCPTCDEDHALMAIGQDWETEADILEGLVDEYAAISAELGDLLG